MWPKSKAQLKVTKRNKLGSAWVRFYATGNCSLVEALMYAPCLQSRRRQATRVGWAFVRILGVLLVWPGSSTLRPEGP